MNILLKRTYLTSGLLFLGLIISAADANGEDEQEGVVYLSSE